MNISFDFWGTLVTPNPSFNEAKVKMLSEVLSVNDKLINDSFIKTKHELNYLVEKDGISFSQTQAFMVLLNRLTEIDPNSLQFRLIIKSYLNLFLKYPPIIDKEINIVALLIELLKLK